jgi:hypothetical protein
MLFRVAGIRQMKWRTGEVLLLGDEKSLTETDGGRGSDIL